MPHQHRAGSLKQKNKPHRGASGHHASKRALKRAQGGKVNAADRRGRPGAAAADLGAGGKARRLSKAKQSRQQHRAKVWLDRRTGSKVGAPLTVLALPLCSHADASAVVQDLLAAATRHSWAGPGALPMGRAAVAVYEPLRARLQCVAVAPGIGELELLDHLRCADVVLPVLSAAEGMDATVDEDGLRRVALLRAVGVPAVVGTVRDVAAIPNKQFTELKRRATRFLADEFGDHAKLVLPPVTTATHQATTPQLLRALTSVTPRKVHWREIRPYLVGQAVEYELAADGSVGDAQAGVLSISGYLRGTPLNVNQLVHIPGVGARKILRITAPGDPCPMRQAARPPVPNEILAEADPSKAEPLRMDAEPDGLMGEQTWPSPEELAMASVTPDVGGGPRPKLPAGVSEYQAAWLGLDDLEEDEDHEEDEDREDLVHLGSVSGQAALRALEAQGAKKKNKDEIFAFLETKGKPSAGLHGPLTTADGGAALDLDGGSDSGEEEEDDEEEGDAAGGSLMGEDLDMYNSPEELERERRLQKLQRSQEDAEFPDEVDTPFDRPARERFARYRALQSLRTSPWDPKESLPRDYARLFDFGDFRVVQKRVLWAADKARTKERRLVLAHAAPSSLASAAGVSSAASLDDGLSSLADGMDEEGRTTSSRPATVSAAPLTLGQGGVGGTAPPRDAMDGDGFGEEPEDDFTPGEWVTTGTYITIQVEGVAPPEAADLVQRGASGIQCFVALHRHENRLSLLNFSVERTGDLFLSEDDVLQSKEPLWAVCGFRRWLCRPIFSEQSLNADKHKYLRFLPEGGFSVASCYGPATFAPAPVLFFRTDSGPSAGQRLQCVATGSIGSVDVDRIILKKIVITGWPIRVHKRTAVIKHMFYTPEDIAWFKPVELTTKMGLSGHIKEPVGTHGLFKVHFGRVIRGNDTVCLNLFKRVYPKFVNTGGDQDADRGLDDGDGALRLRVL